MHWDRGNIEEPGFCRYATETMIPLILGLEQELSGIVTSDDIEYIHRARVATRRLRACFSNFSSCFSNRATAEWRDDIKLITRSLGEARDLDVEIEFIESFISSHVQDISDECFLFYNEMESPGNKVVPALLSTKPDASETETPPNKKILLYLSFLNPEGDDKTHETPLTFYPADINRPGLEALLLRFKKRRQEIQPDVVKTINRLEKSRTTESMKTYLHERKVLAELEGSDVNTPYSYEQAFFHIMTALSDFLSYEPWLMEPLMITRHHEMRIAGKKLRYTLESFSGLFECKLKKEIKTFKSLQDILGEMHDCDVWIANLPDIYHKEEERSCEFFGNHSFFTLLKPGFDELLEDRKANRIELFKNLHDYWFSLKEDKFWDQLEEKITTPLHYSFGGLDQISKDKTVSIALISDVHANLPALEAVLNDAKERGVTAVFNAGDSVGYGAFPDEVVSYLRKSNVLSVIGNYDQSVLMKKWKTKKLHSRDKYIAMRYAFRHLSRNNRAYLKNLPKQIKFKLKDKSLLITHGSPDSMTEYLVSETPESRFSEIAKKTNADIIITGHAHLPSITHVDGVWFVNCGSVGRSEDGDPRACYALLTIDPFSIVHIRVPYEITRAIEAIHERHLPESFERILSEGKPLQMVIEPEEKE